LEQSGRIEIRVKLNYRSVAKKPLTIRVTLPGYQKDRQEWRRQILENVRTVVARRGMVLGVAQQSQYDDDQLLDVEVLLYMKGYKRRAIHDVDNRLKDILDALQGRFRGPDGKKLRLIKNDNKIHRALIEKRQTPKKYKNTEESPGGMLIIRPYKRTRRSRSAK